MFYTKKSVSAYFGCRKKQYIYIGFILRLYTKLLGGFCYEIICTQKRSLFYQRMPDHFRIARLARSYSVCQRNQQLGRLCRRRFAYIRLSAQGHIILMEIGGIKTSPISKSENFMSHYGFQFFYSLIQPLKYLRAVYRR